MDDLWEQLLRYVNGDASAKLPKAVFADVIRQQTEDYREAIEEVHALLETIESERAANAELRSAIELVYGLLWHSVVPQDHVTKMARKILLERIDRDGQVRGIEGAKAAGASVRIYR